MKKILLAMTAVCALAAAAPAAAQSSNQTSASGGFEGRIERLEARIRAGVQQRTISSEEARLLGYQLRQLDDLRDRFVVNGLTREERQELHQRIRDLRRQIRVADGGSYDRYDPDDWYIDDDDDRYGRSDRIDRNNDGFDDRDYDRDGRWDDDVSSRIDRDRDGYDDRDYDRDGRWDDDVNTRIDRDRDGYDDRDYDRDGRWDDDVNTRIDRNNDGYDDRDYDRDGRWDDDVAEGRYEQQQTQQPGGLIGSLINTLIGGGATLRVGDRAPDTLGAVPYQYQNQYRDGNGVYFRSDGRAIYEIETRNRTVVRIHAIAR